MRIKIAFSVCGFAFALGMAQARADGLTPGGTIIGIFSDPIYSGFVTHDPTISSPPAYFDNSATAPFPLYCEQHRSGPRGYASFAGHWEQAAMGL
jgi:hypothetical protein